MSAKLSIDAGLLADYFQSRGIRRLSLFGSHLKGAARWDSDVDLLVEFEPSVEPSLLDMAQLEIELSKMLGGKTVDLRSPDEAQPLFQGRNHPDGGGASSRLTTCLACIYAIGYFLLQCWKSSALRW
jgi:predicted nucleotidyltransferase